MLGSDSSDSESSASSRPLATRAGLFPATPAEIQDERYTEVHRVGTSTVTIEPASYLSEQCSGSSQLPPGWRWLIHPEGRPYFHRQSYPAVVTEADITCRATLDLVEQFVLILADWALELRMPLPASSEVFLELDEDDDCRYYCVDHDRRVVFWLQEWSTSQLGFMRHASWAHLELTLEFNYWCHIYSFPMHGSCQSGALNEITARLMYGRAGQLTSNKSTFMYGDEDCAEFSKVIQQSKESGHALDGHMTAPVARLFYNLTSNKFFTYYGEDNCRLSRIQCLNGSPDEKYNWILTGLSWLSFDLPLGYRHRLDTLFVDRQVSSMPRWHAFCGEVVKESSVLMAWSFASLISNITMLPRSHAPALTQCSLILNTISIVTSWVLCQQHQQPNFLGDAINHLDSQCTTYGFQAIAIVYSLPKALSLWAGLLFAVQASCTLFSNVQIVWLGVFVGVMAAIAFLVWVTIFTPGAVNARRSLATGMSPVDTVHFPQEGIDVAGAAV